MNISKTRFFTCEGEMLFGSPVSITVCSAISNSVRGRSNINSSSKISGLFAAYDMSIKRIFNSY